MIDSCHECGPCLAGDEQYCEGPNSWLATYNGPMKPAKQAKTGENSAIAAGNMPSIKFEISNPTDAATYTTLVYTPDNSASNAWTKIDAAADTGKHWGFTGTWFNADPSRCGLNGARCTLSEALAVLGTNAKFLSAGVGKGRDYAWHGAIRSLTLNDYTYKFTAGGVLAG